jgi:HSP20 family protein
MKTLENLRSPRASWTMSSAERFFGRFQRTVTLPTPVAADKVKAQYKDGILTITLPKTEESKPKHIDVNVS